MFLHRLIWTVARALVENIEAGAIVQGGSTITQQYLKNVLLTPEVTADRKIEEATLALRLEENLSKEEILERYVNTVYLGGGSYGVGAIGYRPLPKPRSRRPAKAGGLEQDVRTRMDFVR